MLVMGCIINDESEGVDGDALSQLISARRGKGADCRFGIGATGKIALDFNGNLPDVSRNPQGRRNGGVELLPGAPFCMTTAWPPSGLSKPSIVTAPKVPPPMPQRTRHIKKTLKNILKHIKHTSFWIRPPGLPTLRPPRKPPPGLPEIPYKASWFLPLWKKGYGVRIAVSTCRLTS